MIREAAAFTKECRSEFTQICLTVSCPGVGENVVEFGKARLSDHGSYQIEIGEKADVPVHISHLKASGQAAWGLAREAIDAITVARERGQRVTEALRARVVAEASKFLLEG